MTTVHNDQDSLLIRVITYLVTPEDDLELGDADEGQELVRWVNTMHHHLNIAGQNIFEKKAKVSTPRKVLSLLCPLRESLLSHRWGEAIRLMEAISHEHHHDISSVVFQVGLELCHQVDPGQGRLLEQLISQIRCLHIDGDNAWEMTLEHVFFLLSQPDASNLIQESLDVFHDFKRPHLNKKLSDRFTSRVKQSSLLMTAYRGQLFYAQWLVAKQKVDAFQAHGTDLNVIEEVEAAHEQRAMDMLAERALDCFKVIRGQPGVWDIFINKSIQMLEYRNDLEEAQNTLVAYAELNSDNPNAHRYILAFHKRHGMQAEAYNTLKILAALLPSDSVVLELYTAHKERGVGFSTTLPLLFTLLDYRCCQYNLEAWAMLAGELLDILHREADEETGAALQQVWSERASWWPQYHFHPSSLKKMKFYCEVAHNRTMGSDDEFDPVKDEMEVTDEAKVMVYRAIVAIVFSSSEHFIDNVEKLVGDEAEMSALLRKARDAAKVLEVENISDHG